jgi:hypothetical protein
MTYVNARSPNILSIGWACGCISIDSGSLPQTIRVKGKCPRTYRGAILLSTHRVTFSVAARPDAVLVTNREADICVYIYTYDVATYCFKDLSFYCVSIRN